MPSKDKKVNTIARWKFYGIIPRENETYQDLWEKVINCYNCEECNVEFNLDDGRSKYGRCLDHDHETGYFRKVLCRSCNADYGKDHGKSKTPITNTSGYKNIHYRKSRDTWAVSVTRRPSKIKTFKTLQEAIEFQDSLN